MATGTGWFSARSMAAFAGGAMAGVIASRILPPFMAQATGTTTDRDPFDALAQDHWAFLSLLREMEESPPGAVFGRTQRLLRLKRRLTAHALAEEDVIYPLLREQANEVEDTQRLYAEHADMKVHLHALEQMPKDDPRWRDRVRELRMLVERHARQEEEVDFPKLRAMLDERAVARLAGEVQREKAFVL